jgi:hypothetical protein
MGLGSEFNETLEGLQIKMTVIQPPTPKGEICAHILWRYILLASACISMGVRLGSHPCVCALLALQCNKITPKFRGLKQFSPCGPLQRTAQNMVARFSLSE